MISNKVNFRTEVLIYLTSSTANRINNIGTTVTESLLYSKAPAKSKCVNATAACVMPHPGHFTPNKRFIMHGIPIPVSLHHTAYRVPIRSKIPNFFNSAFLRARISSFIVALTPKMLCISLWQTGCLLSILQHFYLSVLTVFS